MHRLTELIHRRHLLHPVPGQLHHFQIPCQTGHLTGNVYDPIHSILQYLRQSLWMDAISRRIQHDHVRFFLQFIQHLKYIACYEFTVGNTVSRSIFFCRLHRFFNNLHTDHFTGYRSQNLTDRPCPAEQIEHRHITDITDVFPHRLIQHFRSSCIRLKKREWSDLKFQTEQFFIKEILTKEDSGLVTFHHISKRVI